MAETKRTPGASTPATESETADAVSGEEISSTPAKDDAAKADGETADAGPAKADGDKADEAPAKGAAEADASLEDPADEDPDDLDADARADKSELPYPTRVGWVVAAFLLFWPLAIPALVLSMRTAEANGTGNVRRAKKSSIHTLDFALGAVTVGVLGIVGLTIGIVAAPTYAASLPQGFVAAVRSFVPPALAGPLGISLPDDGPAVAAPTPSPTATDDPYATDDPFAPMDPDAQYPPDSSGTASTPDAGAGPGEGATPQTESTATAGAEIPDLAVGDCIDTAATSGQTTLYRIPVVPCTTAHGGEIYAETTAPDSLAENGAAPTQQALWDAADAYCYPEFTRFVGTGWAQSELLYWPIAPSQESWADGDRRVLCVVESEDPVTGSLEGSER
ncbi:septum formation family protein [Promicromonospora sp. Populi]|uniref:septum formation family protein n=1 Tax=Promicromonospora sp. Populi TaxID=3239420 RepID=UPI0034E2A844